MRSVAGVGIALLMLGCLAGMASADEWETSIGQGDVRIIQQDGCAAGGSCVAIQLFAPGNISSVEFKCVGKGDACGHIHPCPEENKCGAHKNEFEITGPSAMFWAWTDSSNAAVSYKFKIRYEYP